MRILILYYAGTESDTVRNLSLAIESKLIMILAFKDQVIQASGEKYLGGD